MAGALLTLPAAEALEPGSTAPFPAWLDAESAYVHAEPALKSPPVGLLRAGDVVTVTGCLPDCAARGGWALLGSAGAIRLSLLRLTELDDTHRALGASARYLYGTVRGEGLPVVAAPDSTRVIHRLKAGRVLAFRADQPLQEQGWLQTAQGGYVRKSAVRMAKPSTFRGVVSPSAMTAFTLRAATLRSSGKDPSEALRQVERHAALPVIRVDGDEVETPEGLLRRRDVRLAMARRRPPGVPAGVRWVHVDLAQQVLTAYEGDQLVFATLVSTGKEGHATPKGIYRVWLKTVHHRMSGAEPVPYEVDEVPFTQFFNRGVALHGAFWHDAFGSVVSHGCVNLSVADAEWLFDWAPPKLPEGWHAVIPGPSGMESLYVVVEKSAAVRHWSAPIADPPAAEAATPP